MDDNFDRAAIAVIIVFGALILGGLMAANLVVGDRNGFLFALGAAFAAWIGGHTILFDLPREVRDDDPRQPVSRELYQHRRDSPQHAVRNAAGLGDRLFERDGKADEIAAERDRCREVSSPDQSDLVMRGHSQIGCGESRDQRRSDDEVQQERGQPRHRHSHARPHFDAAGPTIRRRSPRAIVANRKGCASHHPKLGCAT